MKPRALLLATLLLTAACATTPTTAPEITPVQQNRYLVDPRPTESTPPSRSTARRFESAWLAYQQGRLTDAERLFSEILTTEPTYVPAILGQAAVALTRGNLDAAQKSLDRAAELRLESPIMRVYLGELAHARGDLRGAYQHYVAATEKLGHPSVAADRREEIRLALFNQLFSQALATVEPETTVTLLREALELDNSDAARRLLSARLVLAGRFDEAGHELEPLISAGKGNDAEVQQLLGEIEVGTGRYEEAISRYERLVRSTNSADYRRRLDQIKQQWTEANMPPQQQRALDSVAITRADLAVLIYWDIPDVRFARNLPEPPIAIDVEDVVAREELVRAMSFRLFNVDPVTRRVDPYRLVTAGNFLRILSRLALLSGIPPCAGESLKEPSEAMRAARILLDCGIPVAPMTGDPDALISGRDAQQALVAVANLLKSTEQRQARQ